MDKSEIEVNRLNTLQSEKYNKKYHHLAYELRNVFGAKTFFAFDVYSLGYILSIYPLKYGIKIRFGK